MSRFVLQHEDGLSRLRQVLLAPAVPCRRAKSPSQPHRPSPIPVTLLCNCRDKSKARRMRGAAALENPLGRMSEVQHTAPPREGAGLSAGGGPGERLGTGGVIYTGSAPSCSNGVLGQGGNLPSSSPAPPGKFAPTDEHFTTSLTPTGNSRPRPLPCACLAYLIN